MIIGLLVLLVLLVPLTLLELLLPRHYLIEPLLLQLLPQVVPLTLVLFVTVHHLDFAIELQLLLLLTQELLILGQDLSPLG